MKDAFFQSCESLIGADHVDATADPPVLCLPSVEFAAELVRWCHEAGRGIGPLLTETERALAVSLKRELDPKGILNPHLQLS
ncbi:hypothetical protein ACFL5H_02520 [Candidatus Latescibacterota bacterium]